MEGTHSNVDTTIKGEVLGAEGNKLRLSRCRTVMKCLCISMKPP